MSSISSPSVDKGTTSPPIETPSSDLERQRVLRLTELLGFQASVGAVRKVDSFRKEGETWDEAAQRIGKDIRENVKPVPPDHPMFRSPPVVFVKT